MTREIVDKWQISEGEYNGAPIVVRLNVGAQEMVGSKEYPFRIGIAVPFNNPQKNGFPNLIENDILAKAEDMIVDYFSKEQNGILCIVITTQGMREFVSYAKKDTIEELLQLLYANFSEHEFQHYTQKDEDWKGYQEWV